MSADARLHALLMPLGPDFSGPLRIGGHYEPVQRQGLDLWVSSQIPRVGEKVLFTGVVGQTLDVPQARQAATICAIRALVFLQREAGSLQAIAGLSRMTVYVRSAPDFEQHSAVADGASDTLAQVLGPVARHARTTVGVWQLPQGASVALDLVARLHEPATPSAL